MKKYLGIDLGSTSISWNLYDADSDKSIACTSFPNDCTLKSAVSYEHIQDAGEIINFALEIIDNILLQHNDICGIGITGQMHGIVYLDNGTAVSPLYTWQDKRAALNDGEICWETEEKTGYRIYPGYGFATFLYNSRNSLAPEKFTDICTLSDYLAMVLCGDKKPKIHPSNAASIGIYNIKNKAFDFSAAEKLGAEISRFPEVCKDKITGEYKGVPVAVSIGDNQASFLGSVGTEETRALANFGTGSQISYITTDTVFSGSKDIEIRPYIGEKNLICGSALCGGKAYALAHTFFERYATALGFKGKQYDIMDSFAEKGIDQGNAVFVYPYFSGKRSDPTLLGRIENISESNFTPESFLAGILIGMSRELRDMFNEMNPRNIKEIIASGNAARKTAPLLKALEKEFGLPVKLSKENEEAALGAAKFSAFCADSKTV